MSNQHVLKIHPAPLADLLSGAKTAEVRRNDRGFQVGDTVRLMEVNPETLNWTGRPDLFRTISHIQTGYGLPDGMCVLSYADTAQREALARVEAELKATDKKLLAKTGAHEFVKHGVNRLVAERDTARAQLAEAVGLLWFIQGYLEEGQDSHVKSKIRSFISRHRLDEYAQAEQPEAQGAQAGDDTMYYRLRAMGLNYGPAHCWDRLDKETVTKAADEIARLRATLATQPFLPAVAKRSAPPSEGEWIEWGGNGTHAPFDEMLGADIRFRDGVEFSPPAVIGLRWNHAGNDKDIVAYRLHKPEAKKS